MKSISKRKIIEAVIRKSLIGENIDLKQFPNPLPPDLKGDAFLTKGFKDGDKTDDQVDAGGKSIPASAAKPSQSAIYLGKALSMAVNGVKGGELNALISADNYILDGHHRWAATMFSNPDATISGIGIAMPMATLIPVLRAVGDAYGNARRGEPEGGDKNIFQAKFDDAKKVIEDMDGGTKYVKAGKASAWLESIGGDKELNRRLEAIKAKGGDAAGAPPRAEMPVIDADKGNVKDTTARLKKGAIDIAPPYAKIQPEKGKKQMNEMNEVDPVAWADDNDLAWERGDSPRSIIINVDAAFADHLSLPGGVDWQVEQDNDGNYIIYALQPEGPYHGDNTMQERQGFKTTHDEDGDLLYILPVQLTGDIGADIKAMWQNDEIASLLWGELGSDEGITDETGQYTYWGSDIQDIVQGLHETLKLQENKIMKGNKRQKRVHNERYGLLMERMLGFKGLEPLNSLNSLGFQKNWLFEEEEEGEEGDEEPSAYCAERSYLSAQEAEKEKEKIENSGNWADSEIEKLMKHPEDLKND